MKEIVNDQHTSPEPESPVEQPQESIESLMAKLADMEGALQRKSVEYDFYRMANEKGMSNIEKVMPYLDLSKVNGADSISEIIGALSNMAPQQKKSSQKPLGEPSNGGFQNRPDKTADAMLREAGEKAKKSGKLEDIAAFSALKQKLFGGK